MSNETFTADARPLKKSRASARSRGIQPARRGMVLLFVLLLLIVVAGVLTTVIGMSGLDRGILRRQWPASQVYWLVESGLEKAAARLARDASYRGEIWQLSPEELRADVDAVVEIHVEPVGTAGRYSVHVQADCPRSAVGRVRVEKTILIQREAIPGAQS